MEEKIEQKKEYEVSFLVKNEADQQIILEMLRVNKADILFDGGLKKASLAYKIKKESQAVFGYLHFVADSASLPLLKNALEGNKSILRHLIIIRPKPSKRASFRSKPRLVPHVAAPPVPPVPASGLLSNEELEKKIEEIIQETR